MTMSNKTRAQRLRLEQERLAKEAQEAREKRIRTIVMISVVGVVALALVGVVVWTVLGAKRGQEPVAAAQIAEIGAVQGRTLVVGQQDAPVTLDVYQDYMCPYCGQFERANRADLQQLVDDGSARLVIHPLAFLDAQSAGTNYSSRAANAAVTVAQYQPDKLLAYNAILYDRQPAEGTEGLSNEQLAELARAVGVDDATIQRFGADETTAFVAWLTDAAFRNDGIKGTPTVKINGQIFSGDLYSAGPLKAAVLDAKGS